MQRSLSLAWLAAVAALAFPQSGHAQHAEYDALVATHAGANAVPEALVHRVIVRESRYQPHLVGRGGTIGLMQIKIATARGLGYTGDAAGLRDPNTNLTYAVKYLAGAYRAANGDPSRAMRYYASGYYGVARRQRLQPVGVQGFEPSGNPVPALITAPPGLMVRSPVDARAQQVPARWTRAKRKRAR
jgi:soluble lytic murein transglycosylase-like protein